MDPDSDRKIEKQRKEINPLQRYIANVGNVLSPIWVRRPLQITDGGDWFILGCRYNFLLYFRMFLVVLYYTVQNII
jgi:hypothetical protein